jgi:outer membrane protein assembly factor BamB
MAMTAAIPTLGWLIGSVILAAVPPVQAPPASPMVDRNQIQTAGLTIYWQRSVPLNKDENVLRVSHLDENLYLLTSQGRVITLDAATGVLRWAVTVAAPQIRVLGPTHGPEVVYFATVLGLQGFDRVSGEQLLKWKGQDTCSSPVTSDGQSLLFGSIEGRMVSVRLRDMLTSWEFATAGMVTAPPIVLGRNVVAVSSTGHIYAADKRDKTRLWNAETTGPVHGTPATYGSHLYVASMDQSLWCFDMVTGQTIWRTRLSTPLSGDPQVTAKHVYLPVTEHGVYSMNPDTGKIDWNREEATGFVAEHENLVWLTSARSSLLGCDKAGGEIRREIPISADLSVSNDDDDAIWLAGNEGHVICLRPQGAGFLRYRSALRAAARTTLPTTRPASQPADQDFVPAPPPKAPTDYLRRNDAIPPVAGSSRAPASQPGSPQ